MVYRNTHQQWTQLPNYCSWQSLTPSKGEKNFTNSRHQVYNLGAA